MLRAEQKKKARALANVITGFDPNTAASPSKETLASLHMELLFKWFGRDEDHVFGKDLRWLIRTIKKRLWSYCRLLKLD